MNLKQLEAFVKVTESGSFSKAAKLLFLTAAQRSVHISLLWRKNWTHGFLSEIQRK